MSEPQHKTSDIRGAIAWMARNHISANLVMALFLVGGALSAFKIKQEVFPDFVMDAVSVSVSYPGASPAEVEQGIVLAIEEAVRGVENVVEVTSTASEGSASVVVEYEAGTNPQQIYQDVQQEVNRITTFPDDAEEPQIALASHSREVVNVQLYGDVSEWALRNLAEDVREQLLQAEGVTLVELEGARDFEVHISPTRQALRAYGLTLQDIADKVAVTSVEVPAGSVDTQAGDVLLRFNERRDYAREFSEIPIVTTAGGAVVKLGDIAEVTESFEDSDRLATYNGSRAIALTVYRVGEQTPNSVASATCEAVAEIAPSLPAGVRLAIRNDRSEVYNQRLNLLMRNMGLGLTLVLTLLGLFLEPRLAFWVMLGVPTAFLGTFLLMPVMGVSLNMISMFAFIVALGIVVDDAIVVGENIYENRMQGMAPVDAAIHGAREVGVPVVFSIVTNCVTFIPLSMIPGTFGKIWFVIPLVVISIFLISLVECLFVLPAHLAALPMQPRNPIIRVLRRGQQKFSRLFERVIERVIDPFLLMCIKVRYLVVAISLALLFVTIGWAASGRMGMTLMPKVESDTAVVTATLPVGSPMAKAIDVRDRLEASARRVVEANGGDKLSEGIYSRIKGDSVQVRVYLTEPDTRPVGTTAFTGKWRADAGEFPGVDTLRYESDRGGPGGGASVTVELSHTGVDTLEDAAARLGELLGEFPAVSDIDTGFQPGKQQLDFTLKPEGRALGLTSNAVARQLRNAFEGSQAIRQQRGRNEVKVRVILPEAQRRSEYDIEQVMIRTPAGADVPLRQIAEIQRGRAYTSIERIDGRRTLEVSGNVTPDEMTNQVLETLKAEVLPALMRDYPGLGWRFGGRQADMRDSLGSLRLNFILALIVIYALLAIPFKSYTQPLTVMIAIPFGIVGAILGHLIMDYSLSVISMMGIIALSGVVINDALVMIVYANDQRAMGVSPFDAIHGAAVRRFRPIMLTTLTTFGGLAPMIFETSRQARFMIPMAISLGYGLLFATTITLLLVPSLYLIEEDCLNLIRKFKPHHEG